MKMTVLMTTIKLILPFGMTKEDVEALLARHTKDYAIPTFNPDSRVGSNRNAFAVVDVPEAAMQKVAADPAVKSVDLMDTYSKKASNAQSCSPGG